ncbi:phospholipase domain-containing protein [Puia sp. P3]|uniref:phospholipase domain-containing protein n=1 Tax=Puia sp. P3 TaxID=3423952 RepID=UPI003D66B89D
MNGGYCELTMEVHGSAGAPFTAYMDGSIRNYAVKSGSLTDKFSLGAGKYDLRVHGPNGWYWEMRGAAGEVDLGVRLMIQDGVLILGLGGAHTVEITDNAYGEGTKVRRPGDRTRTGVLVSGCRCRNTGGSTIR